MKLGIITPLLYVLLVACGSPSPSAEVDGPKYVAECPTQFHVCGDASDPDAPDAAHACPADKYFTWTACKEACGVPCVAAP